MSTCEAERIAERLGLTDAVVCQLQARGYLRRLSVAGSEGGEDESRCEHEEGSAEKGFDRSADCAEGEACAERMRKGESERRRLRIPQRGQSSNARQSDGEDRAIAKFACRGYVAVVSVDEFIDDSEADAAAGSRPCVCAAPESLEDVWELVRRDAHTSVGDGQFNLSIVGGEVDFDLAAWWCELECIREQVSDDLPET